MLQMSKLFATVLILFPFTISAQGTAAMRQKIQDVLITKNAIVGVSIVGNNGKDTLTINGERHYPMQSVFKFPIALAVLSEVDKGVLSLKQKIEIPPKDQLPNIYSPIRDKYPEGVSLTLAEVLKYTVSASDNIGCDALLKLIGGPKVVEDYFLSLGFKNMAIKINEEVMQANWDLQFQNWTIPEAATTLLASFYDNKTKLISKKSHRFIWKIMRETETGLKRLKEQLPKGTVVAHKTGWSGTNKAGLTAAVNDIGIVFLPNGKHFFISVFVTDSMEKPDENEKIIADIAKIAYDYFSTSR
jgi:beta-lactamase class A